MDTFLSFKFARPFVQNYVPIKNTVLSGISSKGARKAFLVTIKNKILLQTLKIL